MSTSPNIESRFQFPQKEYHFNFVHTKILLTIRHFQNGLIEHNKVNRTELIWNFSILGQQAWRSQFGLVYSHMTFQNVDIKFFVQFAFWGQCGSVWSSFLVDPK